MPRRPPRRWIEKSFPLVALATMLGCHSRAAQIAVDAADRQAEQNRVMADLQRQVAAGTRRLAEHDAQARRQALAVQRDLQAERTQLNDGFGALEGARQAIADQRRTESFLAALVAGGGAAAAAGMALAFAWLALRSAPADDLDPATLATLLAEGLPPELLFLSSTGAELPDPPNLRRAGDAESPARLPAPPDSSSARRAPGDPSP